MSVQRDAPAGKRRLRRKIAQYHVSAGRSKRLPVSHRDFDGSGREIRTSLRSPRAREGVDCKEGDSSPTLPVFFGAFFYHKKKATSSAKLHLGTIKKLALLEKQPSIFGK